MLFEDFDFELLNDPGFKEDSVREELIAPLLKALGYSASPPNQITRSPSLVHPYVYIGTRKYPITIIPDYVLRRNGQSFAVIDAKNPGEEIHKGKNVEQAYSYAIHKDVRAEYFALCNGHEFVLFHISKWPETFSFRLSEINGALETLVRLLGTHAERKKTLFKPDLGLHMMRLGFALDKNGKRIHHLFMTVDLFAVGRVDEERYSLQSHMGFGDVLFLGTFDFDKRLLPKLLGGILPTQTAKNVEQKLKYAPFFWNATPQEFGFVGISCKLGDHVYENEDEHYWPFIVDEFF